MEQIQYTVWKKKSLKLQVKFCFAHYSRYNCRWIVMRTQPHNLYYYVSAFLVNINKTMAWYLFGVTPLLTNAVDRTYRIHWYSYQWIVFHAKWLCLKRGRQERSGPRLNIKTVFPRYGDSYVKEKTVVCCAVNVPLPLTDTVQLPVNGPCKSRYLAKNVICSTVSSLNIQLYYCIAVFLRRYPNTTYMPNTDYTDNRVVFIIWTDNVNAICATTISNYLQLCYWYPPNTYLPNTDYILINNML